MYDDEPSIEQLLAEADALPEPGTLGAALDAINRSVSDETVAVTVNLHGKLVGLELAERAMSLPPAELADRISRATTEAAAAALADGMHLLTETCGEAVVSAVQEHVSAVQEHVSAIQDDDEDGFAPRSWAIAWDAN